MTHRFWWSCEQYRTCSESGSESEDVRIQLANEIWQRHLADKAQEPINVDAAAKRSTALRLSQRPLPADLFAQAQKQIFNVMKFDSYPRFLRSGVHAECARADLRGLPCPYDQATKLKKSSSNASERRRSAGLLPWRRNASRDRADEEQPVTDVVTASQTNGCSLCRVVLPGGATTVVGVDNNLTVRRLVDRLLQKRNLLCTAYDVLLEEQGTTRVVEAEAASSVLGGKCAVVERRCVVRVQVGARGVLVRCRPARRLRHVLRPLLARYPPPPAPRRAPPRARPLPPDTLLQDLDGARLQIVEVGEGDWQAVLVSESRGEGSEGEGEVVGGERVGEGEDSGEGDADSLADLALRHDEDTLSIDRNSGSSCGFPDNISNRSSGPPAGPPGPQPQGPANRVRATLRPGPPLHHHPPDFLENLRETQRQRLQPRTPPPLPPKPTHRPAPTLV
ncbi:unnamed protein product [Colias eurytheme]|nr:unnamed protein product [Colias eurytheme]